MIKEMSFWKWLGLLVAGFLLATLMYGLAGTVDLLPKNLAYCVMCLMACAAMVGLYALFVRWFEGAWPQDLPLKKQPPHTALGLCVGLGYFVVVIGIMALAGSYKVIETGMPVRELFCAFFYFGIVAVGEEIIFRGVVFRWIDQRWGFPAALAASALIFGFVHIINPGATLWSSVAIAIEAGLLLGAAYKWAGTLWFPIGIHWAWNFSQGNIFGFLVSGQDAGQSLLHASIQGPDWLTGGSFGAEASVIAVVVGSAVSAWLVYRIYKR